MRNRQYHHQRPGATLVECAVVYPVTLLLTLGLMIGAIGIFRYQEMATLAREAARYAVVHGTDYGKDAGVAPPSDADIYAAAVTSRAVALDLSSLSYSITWNVSNAPHQEVVDSSGNITSVNNTVRVTLTYQWIPEAFLGGITLSSTSEMPMSY
jgi:Flp pilus assembly protein TadG